MGNTSSGVTSGVKNQATATKALYKYADLGGGGSLLQLLDAAIATKDFDELDRVIKTEMPQFLYGAGEGKSVHISEVITIRHKERTGTDLTKPIDKKQQGSVAAVAPKEGVEEVRKEVCWSLDERGGVGETVLHVCFLVGSHKHMVLAKRLLLHFPKLINDVYVSEEYYGENVLHMAIVNEDPQMVRYLLDLKVDVHQRCCGNFFTPDDQKSSRSDVWNQEHVECTLKSNFAGHMYWGEYPLSFAACLSQEECFRLLIAKGAKPDMRDSNGNTVLHIMVVQENKEMFDLAEGCGASLHIKNRQGLTPLALSAKLAKAEMFNHVLNIEREVYWQYGPAICAGYPLEHTDSIHPATGCFNRNSALALVVYGDSLKHLGCYNEFLEELLKKKWATFAKNRLYRQLVMFCIYFFLMFLAFWLRPTPYDSAHKRFRNDSCYLRQVVGSRETMRLLLEIAVLFYAVAFLSLNLIEVNYVGKKLYIESLSLGGQKFQSGFPAKALFLVSLCLVTLLLPLRVACLPHLENVVAITAVLLSGSNFLFLSRGFKLVGVFVLTIYKIVVKDLLRFFLIYSIFIAGFSQGLISAFYIIFLGYKRNDPSFHPGHNATILSNVFESFNRMFIMSLNEFQVFYDKLNHCTLAFLGKIMFMIYCTLVSILLINMLIAMMNNTYTAINETKREWLRQWAAMILILEQGLSPLQRMEAQRDYSSPMARDPMTRALIVTGRIPESELAEQKQEVEEAKREFWRDEMAKQRAKAMAADGSDRLRAQSLISLFDR